MEVILFQPQIPQNTGNIIRTCNVTNTKLTLVRPFGFSTSARQFKRAGLDYFADFVFTEIDDLFSYLENSPHPFYFFSSKAEKKYTDISYKKDVQCIFGSETFGLDSIFFETWPERFVTIPMKKNSRCLNLSNSVAITVYEVLRQNNFSTLS